MLARLLVRQVGGLDEEGDVAVRERPDGALQIDQGVAVGRPLEPGRARLFADLAHFQTEVEKARGPFDASGHRPRRDACGRAEIRRGPHLIGGAGQRQAAQAALPEPVFDLGLEALEGRAGLDVLEDRQPGVDVVDARGPQIDEAVVVGVIGVQVELERARGEMQRRLDRGRHLGVEVDVADLEGAGGDVRPLGEQLDLAGRAGVAGDAEAEEQRR